MGPPPAPPRERTEGLGLVGTLQATPNVARGLLAPARRGQVGGMAQAGGGAGSDAGQEDSAAAGPFSFSPEPTLEDM